MGISLTIATKKKKQSVAHNVAPELVGYKPHLSDADSQTISLTRNLASKGERKTPRTSNPNIAYQHIFYLHIHLNPFPNSEWHYFKILSNPPPLSYGFYFDEWTPVNKPHVTMKCIFMFNNTKNTRILYQSGILAILEKSHFCQT